MDAVLAAYCACSGLEGTDMLSKLPVVARKCQTKVRSVNQGIFTKKINGDALHGREGSESQPELP